LQENIEKKRLFSTYKRSQHYKYAFLCGAGNNSVIHLKLECYHIIDYLREHDVRVLSATENIDTFNENDDLIIGFKGLVNDFYARDGSRRVRTGFRQKQKEGIVMIPPFGYFKDKNTYLWT